MSKQVNFGIIGYGRIAKRFIENLKQTDGNLYAIASKSAMKNATEVPCDILYGEYSELIQDENVDVIYIALPHLFHYDVIMECIENHKAVICEKPMVLTKEQIVNVKEAARKNHVLVMEALKSRFIPAYIQMKKDIESIELESLSCGFCYYVPVHDSYLFDPRQGGALNDVGSYSIGFVLDLIQKPIINIESTMKKEHGVDVHFATTLTFEGGIKATVEGAMDEKKDSIAYIQGKKGSMKVPYFYRPSTYTVEYNTGEVVTREYNGEYDMRYEIEEMIQLVNEGKVESERMSLDDSEAIMDVVEAIRTKG